MGFRIRGAVGELLAGGRLVGTLSAWELAPVNEGWQLTAALRIENAMWATQARALDVRLHIGPQRWRWRRVDMKAVEGALIVNNLGEPERS